MTANLSSVREALAHPREAPIDEWRPANDGDDGRFGGRPPKAMPADCPVTPVGTEDGVFYYLTALGELRGLSPEKVSNNHIKAMFAPEIDYLAEHWPQKKMVPQRTPDGKPAKDDDGNVIMEPIVTGWKSQDTTSDLMDAAAARGVWNAREKVRGRGAWLADDGSLILHCGNHVLIGGTWKKPGMHEDMVYPTAPPIPKPAGDKAATAREVAPLLVAELKERGIPIANDASPAVLVFELIKTWRWRRDLVDPILLLGWICAAMVGGALDYRPIVWVTGGKAAGKSTFQEMMDSLFHGGILQTPNASEAAVRQTLGQQSLPVGVDEAEAESDNRKMMALVTLARLAASSQGMILRGGQDHKATEFRATSCFLFSSILVPPLTPADRSRIALLELEPFPRGTRKLGLKPFKRELQAVGAWLRKRIADAWPMWPDILETWTDALITEGDQGGRAADQFGTLRAMAQLVLDDDTPDDEEITHWATLLGRETLAETAGELDEGPICLDIILSSQVQLAGHGQQRSVASWVEQASRPIPLGLAIDVATDARDAQRKANEALEKIGLKVVPVKEQAGRLHLAVAVSHQGLGDMLRGEKFAHGVWTQALGRLTWPATGAPAAIRDHPVRLDHRVRKCTLIPVELCIDREGAEEAAEREGVDG